MPNADAWKVIRSETDTQDRTVEMRYAEFGKGRAKCRYWRIFRDGVYVGYGSIESDAHANFDRVMSGYTRDAMTGRYTED